MKESRPLWSTEDQLTLLEELLSDSPAMKEAPLRRDVRLLGRLLGQVLVEQEGRPFYDSVERMRLLAIQHRETPVTPRNETLPADPDLMDQFTALVAGLSLEDAYRMSKAFSIYFELTNLAENNHRKRRLRSAGVPL